MRATASRIPLTRHPRFRRRGSGYVLILGAAMLVSAISLTSLTVARVQWRAEQTGMSTGRARLYARSGIESAIAYTLADPTWRANYNTLVSYMPMPLDQGSCSVTICESDGSPLIGNLDSPVLLTGVGVVGSTANPQALARWSVQAHHPPLDLLRTALHSAGNLYVNSWSTADLEDGPLSTAGTLNNSGTIRGDVEAGTIYNWGSITGERQANMPAKQMPSGVWDYYRTLPGLVVLPANTIGNTMEWALLSPASNPYSSNRSADGLYYIQPSGDFRIRNCRIVGTLIVDLYWGKKLLVEDGVYWAPARPDYPSLLVDGACDLRVSSYLYEAGRVNFNPSTTPFQGTTDFDWNDTYSSLLQGVFHVMGSSSSVLIDTRTRVKGVLIADGSVTIRDEVQLTADPNLFLSPPVKYRMSHLELDAGTWQPVISASN